MKTPEDSFLFRMALYHLDFEPQVSSLVGKLTPKSDTSDFLLLSCLQCMKKYNIGFDLDFVKDDDETSIKTRNVKYTLIGKSWNFWKLVAQHDKMSHNGDTLFAALRFCLLEDVISVNANCF